MLRYDNVDFDLSIFFVNTKLNARKLLAYVSSINIQNFDCSHFDKNVSVCLWVIDFLCKFCSYVCGVLMVGKKRNQDIFNPHQTDLALWLVIQGCSSTMTRHIFW